MFNVYQKDSYIDKNIKKAIYEHPYYDRNVKCNIKYIEKSIVFMLLCHNLPI